MILSRCCKGYVYQSNDHYVCESCNLSCDVIAKPNYANREKIEVDELKCQYFMKYFD